MKKKSIFLLLLITIVVIGLVGCTTGGNGTESTPATEGTPTTETEKAPEPKTLRIAQESVFNTGVLDPILNNNSSTQQYLGYVFESLIGRELDGDLTPNLATDWYPNEDGTVWTIELKQGVKFHDWGAVTGKELTAEDLEMTAEDVKFSIEHFISEESIASAVLELRETIKDIVVKDPYTVEIHLVKSYPDFVDFFLHNGPSTTEGWVMSKKYWDEVGAEGFKKHPIGTNLYQFVEYREGDYISFEAVKDHWSGVTPAFDNIIVMEVPEETARIAMLKNGEADLIDTTIEGAISLRDEGYTVKTTELAATCMRFYGIWDERAIEANMPISHREVREALSLAINRQEIVDNMFGGMLVPYSLPGVSTGRFGKGLDLAKWEEWAKNAYRYDPERAKELLAEAGFPDGFEISVWSFNQGTGGSYTAQLWELISSYWEGIGVKTKIQPVDYAGYMRDAFRQRPQPDELIGTITIQTGNPNAFPIPKMGNFYGPQGTQMLLDRNNEEWMELCSAMESELDPDKQVELFNEVAQLIGDNYITPGLFYQAATFVASDRLAEWEVVQGLGAPSAWIKTFKAAE